MDKYGKRFPNSSGGGGSGLRELLGDTGSGGQQTEMVEKIVREVGDVMEGRKTWKDLLLGVVGDAAGGGESVTGSDDSGRRRRRRRRRETRD